MKKHEIHLHQILRNKYNGSNRLPRMNFVLFHRDNKNRIIKIHNDNSTRKAVRNSSLELWAKRCFLMVISAAQLIEGGKA